MADRKPKRVLTVLISIFSLIIVGISLTPILFPGLITANVGFQEYSNQFEFGSNTALLLVGNITMITFGVLSYKKKLPNFIQTPITKFLKKNISNKITVILLLAILIPYIGFTTPELFLDEYEQAADYEIFLTAKEIFPFGQTTSVEAVEQNDRYVRMILLLTSLDIFGNVKIIPFLGSIALLLTTFFLTRQLTKNNNIAGVVSMLILIQSYTFLRYDSFAMYENFWVLFYIISLYIIQKKWHLSSVSYILSIFTKTFTAIFLPLSLVFVYYSNIKSKTKILLVISYAVMFGVVVIIWNLDSSIYSSVIRFDISQLLIGFTKLSYQLRFDLLLIVALLPLTIALIIKARQGIHAAASVLFLITGSIAAGPIVEIFSDFYVILPYRFVPTIVFFAIGVGVLFNNKTSN